MFGEKKTFMVEYEMIWGNKVVESDIVEVENYDKWKAEIEVKNQIQNKNKKAIVNIKNTVQVTMN